MSAWTEGLQNAIGCRDMGFISMQDEDIAGYQYKDVEGMVAKLLGL